jgi:signal transduction histidine kinase
LSVTAYVEDDGPGIPPDRLVHLFQRFGSVTPRRHGSGLGLAYVREAAERHGGKIAFTAASLRGARFELTLPAIFDGES